MPVEWNDEQIVKRVEKACERGVTKGAFILQEAIRDRLGRVGMFKSFDKQADDNDRAFVRDNGFVDPPGGSPRLRSGRLQRAITTAKINRYRREVGLQGGLEYGPIHEFGGPINHPGGTPYIVVSDKATGQPKPVFLRKSSSFNPGRKSRQQRGGAGLAAMVAKGVTIKFTKPHTINMPARPFIRPSATEKAQAVKDAIASEIAAAVKGGV